MAFTTNIIPDLHLVGASSSTQCFPFYTYNEDGSGRRENITEWALRQFQVQYGEGISKLDIFHYVYALLHHPIYRERYTENLKRELYRVTKMRLSLDKTALVVKDALTLTGIPPEVFKYRLGNRSALEWVIDQYQVSTDPRSGITSDPNREDDPEYIVWLLKQVVTVSVETVQIVNTLPPLALPEPV